MAHLEQHLRLLRPARVLALEEVAEEALLEAHAIVRVEVGPVLDPVDLEPFLLRGRAHEALEVAARMQPLTAPVRRREERHRDPGPVGQARAPVLVRGQRVLEARLVEVAAAGAQLLLGQGGRPGDPVAGHPAPVAARAAAVLHPHDLRGEPGPAEGAEDAAVVAEVAVEVGRPLPDADGGQMRRLERRHLPLVHGVVGDAVEPHLAAAPRLRGCPLDAAIEIARLAGRPDVEDAGRAAGPARVHAQAGIAVRHPLLRVHHLPVLVLVRGAREHVGVLRHHAAPLISVEVLEVQPLGIGAVGEDDGVRARPGGPVHIGAEDQAVVHRDGDVPVDAHAVADLAREVAHGRSPRQLSCCGTDSAWRNVIPPGRLLHSSAPMACQTPRRQAGREPG